MSRMFLLKICEPPCRRCSVSCKWFNGDNCNFQFIIRMCASSEHHLFHFIISCKLTRILFVSVWNTLDNWRIKIATFFEHSFPNVNSQKVSDEFIRNESEDSVVHCRVYRHLSSVRCQQVHPSYSVFNVHCSRTQNTINFFREMLLKSQKEKQE